MFRQDWDDAVQSSDRCCFFYSFKCVLEEELYLSHVTIHCFRVALTQFRLGVLPLNNNMFRYDQCLARRNCPICTEIEDEEHFFTKCPIYRSLRSNIFPDNFPRSASIALSWNDTNRCQRVAKFVFLAFKIRNRALYSSNAL